MIGFHILLMTFMFGQGACLCCLDSHEAGGFCNTYVYTGTIL